MQLLVTVLTAILALSQVQAHALAPDLASVETAPECAFDEQVGVCETTATCASQHGVSSPNYCNGPANVQCCTNIRCGTSDRGECQTTALACAAGYHFITGACPGPSSFKCCYPN